jgi:hypothetical protein
MTSTSAIVLSLVCSACSGQIMRAPAPASALTRSTFVAEYIVPETSEEIGGLSGAWYDDRARRLWTISDDRDRPRLVVFDLSLQPSLHLTMREVIALRLPDGVPTLDSEGLAPGQNGHLFVSSEREGSAGIFEFDRSGRFIRQLPLPAWSTRLRGNRGLESLTVSPDGTMLFTATESSLHEDGDQADADSGVIVRVLAYDLKRGGSPPREYAYRTEPVRAPQDFGDATGNNGVSELLALGSDDLLVLERGYVETLALADRRATNTIRLYRVRLSAAAEVTGRELLEENTPVLSKTLVLDVASASQALSEKLKSLENFEGMTFGPQLPDGSRSLLLVSDDNFSDRQITAFLLFRLP